MKSCETTGKRIFRFAIQRKIKEKNSFSNYMLKAKFLSFLLRLCVRRVMSQLLLSCYILNDIAFGIQELFNHMQLPCRK